MNKYEELLKIFSEMEEEENIQNQNELKIFDEQIEQISHSLVTEAVKHFSSKFFRKSEKGDFDERYFYTAKEFELFKKLNKNPNVKFKIQYDEVIPNKIYCYIAYR